MPTWKDNAQENYSSAILLVEDKQYRSAISRLYYAAFALLTGELIARNAAPDFAGGRATPGHAQLPELVETWFTQFSEERRRNLARQVADLYGARIRADYSVERIDREALRTALRSADNIFRYLDEKVKE